MLWLQLTYQARVGTESEQNGGIPLCSPDEGFEQLYVYELQLLRSGRLIHLSRVSENSVSLLNENIFWFLFCSVTVN